MLCGVLPASRISLSVMRRVLGAAPLWHGTEVRISHWRAAATSTAASSGGSGDGGWLHEFYTIFVKLVKFVKPFALPTLFVSYVFWGAQDWTSATEIEVHRNRARHASVCHVQDAPDELDAALFKLDRLRSVSSSSMASLVLHYPPLCVIYKTLRPERVLDTWEAHLAYHRGALYLLDGEGSNALAQFTRAKKVWARVAWRDATAEARERRRERGRATLRVGDVHARFSKFDKARDAYEEVKSICRERDDFIRVRVDNNTGVLRFAEGLDDSAIEDMVTARNAVSAMAKGTDLFPDAAARSAFKQAMLAVRERVESRDEDDFPSAVQHVSSSEVHKGALERFAEKFKEQQVDTLILSGWGVHSPQVTVERLDRAKHILRKQLTARSNLVHMAACAHRSAFAYIEDLTKEEGGEFAWLTEMYSLLDRDWLEHSGGIRLLTALGIGLAGMLERGDVHEEVKADVIQLAKRCLDRVLSIPNPVQHGGKFYRARLLAGAWRGRLACTTGDTEHGLAILQDALQLFARLSEPASGTPFDSPRDVRIAALAQLTRAEFGPRNGRAQALDLARQLVSARGLGHQLWRDDIRPHPVVIDVDLIAEGRGTTREIGEANRLDVAHLKRFVDLIDSYVSDGQRKREPR